MDVNCRLYVPKNYQICLRGFKDKSKNVRLSRFLGPRCIFSLVCADKLTRNQWVAQIWASENGPL